MSLGYPHDLDDKNSLSALNRLFYFFSVDLWTRQEQGGRQITASQLESWQDERASGIPRADKNGKLNS
jgi:hypothetical protein